jgi:hypothetical protein
MEREDTQRESPQEPEETEVGTPIPDPEEEQGTTEDVPTAD